MKKPFQQLGLWVTGLLPLVALGIALRSRYGADQARQRTHQGQEHVATRQELRSIFSLPAGKVIASMAVGPNNQLAVASWEPGKIAQQRLQRFDLKTALPVGEPVVFEGFPMPGMAFTPDGKRLVLPLSSKGHETVAFRDPGTGQLQKQIVLPDQPTEFYRGGVLSPDASYFIRPGSSGALQLFSTTSGKPLMKLQPLAKLPASVSVSTPQNLAISGNGDWLVARMDREYVRDFTKIGGELTLWHRKEGKARWRVPVCSSGGGWLPLTVGKNGDSLAFMELPKSATEGRMVACLEATKGKVRWSFPTAFSVQVTGLAISSDGRLAAISTLKTIEVRRMSDGGIVAQWAHPEGLRKRESGLQALTFTPDGSQLLEARGSHLASWSLEGLK